MEQGLGVTVVEYLIYTVGFYGLLVGLAVRETRVEAALKGTWTRTYLQKLFPVSILLALFLALYSVAFGASSAAKAAFYLLVLSICFVVAAATTATTALTRPAEER